ncbi:NAD(P)/FAD-dependent oxidoreductase [Desulfogranum mediterraneum]|uniref:NAD(P)/FAD-dependent oxidoreductase n=1 Tax=Desulfogranum mediterraneum TaxID=160661 RepID=UPI000411D3ED|nr:FAD-binding oxidoreductase [Desulfogranum mediterraneum]
MSTTAREHDIIIVGGGISGVALAYGLADRGRQITLLDGPTATDKASRTNVGLIWCQSKFAHLPDYASLAFLSARLFPELSRELSEVSGLEIPVNYRGGLIPCLGEEEYSSRADYIDRLRQVLEEYPGEMISRSQLERKLPAITFGPEVTGAAWCEADGIIDPLALLRAYKVALTRVGVTTLKTLVHQVEPLAGGGYRLHTATGPLECQQLVLAAGLANRRLANFAIPDLPVHADKGQVLLVERLPQVMPIPMLGVTQTFGGTVIIGFRHEYVGHDTQVVPSAVASEGQWAIRVWPALGKRRLIRTWSGLRVMPKDSQAIYSRLPGHPGVTLVNTHSAVTLAAFHTRLLADYLLGGELPELARKMTLNRFGFAS